MEATMNPRFSDRTIDQFCFYSGRNPEQELTRPQKRTIVEERVQSLIKTDWQRWTPFLGFYRMLKDIITRDSILLTEMRPLGYTVANIAYNVLTTGVGSALLVNHLSK
jgi:hypothetical protein